MSNQLGSERPVEDPHIDHPPAAVSRVWSALAGAVPPGLRNKASALRSRSRGAPSVYREHRYLIWVVLMALVAIIVPRVLTTPPHQFLVNIWVIYAITAVGFYWIFGLAGKFAFCQTFMMALGGYFANWMMVHLGADWFLLSLVGAMAASAVAALIIGLLFMRATLFFFAIGTLAITGIGNIVFANATGFTGPSGTVLGVPAPNVFGHELISYGAMFWLLLVILALVVLFGIWLERAPTRRDAIAARDNYEVARTLGVPVVRVQLTLFVLGSATGGLAGALLGAVTGTISTSSFGTQLALGIFLMLLIGGMDSIWGPIVGAAFYVAIPQWLSGAAQYQEVVYGALLLVVIVIFPQGLVGGLRAASARLTGTARPAQAKSPWAERLRQLIPSDRRGDSHAP